MIFQINSLLLVLSIVLFATGCSKPEPVASADLVFINAYVYTANESRQIAQSVAIEKNQIVYVGSDEGVVEWIGEDTVVRDMNGSMVMPGLHDMHVHAMGTVEPNMCDLDSQPHSLEEMIPRLQGCIDEFGIEDGEWLIVLQWPFSIGNQPSADLPHIRAALDAVSTEHPIFLWGDDGHHGAANSLAFSLATTPDGDSVEINAESLAGVYLDFQPMIGVDDAGEPTGGINEDARLLVRGHFMNDMLGMDGSSEIVMPKVAARMAESGITSLQDAIVTPESLEKYAWLEESGGMTFRLRAALVEPPTEDIDEIDAHLEALSVLRMRFETSPLIDANAVKLFADAVLEGNPLTQPPTLPVAATLQEFKQPIFAGSIDDGTFDVIGYVDTSSESCKAVQTDPDTFKAGERIQSFLTEHGYYPQQCIRSSGILEHDEPFIRAYIRKATEAGFHVHVHALSDAAVRIAVDEMGKVKETADRLGTTQSLAHVQLAHPNDQKKIGELGISVVFTFVWTTPSVQYEMMVAPFIDEIDGIDNLYNPDTYYMQNLYPAKSIQEAGGIPVNGSDAPVGGRDPVPFVSLQQALFRSNGEQILNEDERLDIHSALAAFTINGARLFGHDDRLGTIEVGKTADLIALNQNVVELAESGRPDEISDTLVTLTVFDGRVVFERAP